MKKSLILLLAIVLTSFASFAQVEKNLVRSYPFSGAKTVTLAVEGPIEIEEWDEKIVRLVTTIEAVNFNESTLKALAEAGRYACDYKDNFTDGMILSMNKAQRELTIRGVKIEEKYRFKIFVPKGTTVEQVHQSDVSDSF